MRHVQIVQGLRVRFPGRSDDFDEGVEIGAVAALMATAGRTFSQRISSGSLDQIRPLAAQLGYRLVIESSGDGWSDVSFRMGPARPRLMLAHSRQVCAAAPATPDNPGGRQPGAVRRAELRCV